MDPFHITFINTGDANNGRNPPFCSFPVTEFINEAATGCINKEATGAINEAAIYDIIHLLVFLFQVLVFVSVAPSVKKLHFSSDSII